MDDLLADFLTETNEGLAELDKALLRLEQVPGDQATLSLVFRLVHTIKGTCGFLRLARLEAVAHAAETVLGHVRDGRLAVTPGLISGVLRALDVVKMIVAGLEAAGTEPVGDDGALLAALHVLVNGGASNILGPAADDAPEPGPDTLAQAPTLGVPQSIRVGVDVLENLMTLVSELVLARNQLLQIARTRDDPAFAAPLQRLSHVTSDLQEGVMKTRMQPIGNAWAKLPRLVRDLAHDLGKRIELQMHGQDTELDRQVLELMRDPLTHMVRNSADHGLERPEERRVAGKPETGRIQLNAYHEGGQILIEVSDGGRGLALDRIQAKALSHGFATEAELAAMTEAQLYQLIFRPGFSTAAEVTSVSGRGVGLDVVRANIERIGGSIELHSKPGAGSCFTITIPLTLAIVSALIVEAAGERFAIPQAGVVELVHARPRPRLGARPSILPGGEEEGAAWIEHIEGTPVLRLRDRLLPLVSLAELLRHPPVTDEPLVVSEAYIVVTSVGTTTLGVIVDRVFDTEEIVVKPVAPILRHITMFSGNTILGDGSVIMILDPSGIARAAGVGTANEARRAVSTAQAMGMQSEERTSILLFRAGRGQPRAVPLGLVARLEHIPHERIEGTVGRYVTQYRGQLMPLLCVDPDQRLGSDQDSEMGLPILVFTEGERSMGLVVDEILDVVTDRLHIELGGAKPGVLGSAVIAGRATEVLDAGYWLAHAGQEWFRPAGGHGGRARVLCIEDSDFFRQMLVPTLSAAGYQVSTVESAERALALQNAGVQFDVVVSDIEMEGLGGLGFARDVRAGGAWAALPLVALSGLTAPADVAAGRAAGFTEYVAKLDRAALLSALQRCLRASAGSAA